METALPSFDAAGDAAALAMLVCVLIPVVAIDVRARRIPDVLVLPALAAAIVLRGVWGSAGIWSLAWGAIAAACLLVPALIRPDGMGLGDVKLAAVIGVCIGAAALAAVYVALVAGAVVGSVWALVRGVPVRGATIAFAPFLAIGALASGLPPAFLHWPGAA